MNQKISSFQSILLVMSTILPTAVLTVPGIVVGFSGQDSWISIVLAAIVGVAVALLIGSISRDNPKATLLEGLKYRLGNTVGTGIGILLTYYYFTGALIILREFVNFLADNVLTKTPVYMLLCVSVAVIVYAVYHGIEVIARINQLIVPVFLLFFFITALLLAPNFHFSFLLPVMDHPVSKIVQGGIIPAGWLSEVSVLMLLGPFLNRPAEAGKAGIWSVIVVGVELGAVVITAIVIFGPQLISHMSYPTFDLVGIIRSGRFLERIDILFISMWICMMYVKMSIFMFGAFHCFVQSFSIRSKKPILLAMGLLSVISTLYTWPKSADFSHFVQYALAPYLLAFNVLLPFMIWLFLRIAGTKTVEARK